MEQQVAGSCQPIYGQHLSALSSVIGWYECLQNNSCGGKLSSLSF